MQQPTGHYASGSVYPSGPPSDAPYPYAHMASYGSAPPYTSSPSYYADNVAHQPNAQAPPYVPSQQSLADSMASLSMSPQGLYATAALPQGSYATPAPIHAPAQASVSYAPTVPFYEQSYGAGAATPSQNPSHQQSLPSQPLSYVPAGFADVPPYPQAGYDPLPSSHMGSYHSNPPSTYKPARSLMGSYETNQQISAAKATGVVGQVIAHPHLAHNLMEQLSKVCRGTIIQIVASWVCTTKEVGCMGLFHKEESTRGLSIVQCQLTIQHITTNLPGMIEDLSRMHMILMMWVLMRSMPRMGEMWNHMEPGVQEQGAHGQV